MSDKKKFILSAVIFLIFAGLMIAGIYTGEVKIVFAKAVRICLECIGIG